MDQLYLRGNVKPLQQIFGVQGDPVIIPFRKRDFSSQIHELKVEVNPKQEVVEEQGEQAENDGYQDMMDHLDPDWNDDPDEPGDTDNVETSKEVSEESFACSECEYRGQSKLLLSRHWHYNHKEDRPAWVCKHCGCKFAGSSGLRRHIRRKHLEEDEINDRERSIACLKCPYRGKSEDDIAAHWKAMHDDSDKIFHCKECSYKSKTKKGLRMHLKRVHKVGQKMTGDCSEYLKDEQKIIKDEAQEISNSHFEEEEGEDEDGKNVTIFKCRDCDFRTKQRCKIRRHVDDRHLNPFQHVCYTCGKAFAEKKFLSEHVKRVHLDERVSCDVCGFRGSNAHLVKIHKLLKHEGYVQPCPYCDKLYSDKTGCRDHVRREHKGQPVKLPQLVRLEGLERKPYTPKYKAGGNIVFNGVCLFEDCSLEFRNIIQLLAHQKGVHGKTRLGCQHTGCSFVGSQGQVRAHYKREHEHYHHPPDGFFCDQCVFSTARKSHLKDHIEAVHEGVRYTCKICAHVANNKVQLRSHVNKNHREKHTCQMCGFNTHMAGNLRAHIERKHGADLSPVGTLHESFMKTASSKT